MLKKNAAFATSKIKVCCKSNKSQTPHHDQEDQCGLAHRSALSVALSSTKVSSLFLLPPALRSFAPPQKLRTPAAHCIL